jgi:hypothetical protein
MEGLKKISVNEPCPCGSGQKYKRCCLVKGQQGSYGRNTLIVAAAIIALVGLAVWQSFTSQSPERIPAVLPAEGSAPPPSAPTPAATAATPGSPTPWQYDKATNRHWDPNHKHWHDGPPPSNRETPSSAPALTATPDTSPGETPAPWTYDAANNRHWDPNHNHWHQGPPPKP